MALRAAAALSLAAALAAAAPSLSCGPDLCFASGLSTGAAAGAQLAAQGTSLLAPAACGSGQLAAQRRAGSPDALGRAKGIQPIALPEAALLADEDVAPAPAAVVRAPTAPAAVPEEQQEGGFAEQRLQGQPAELQGQAAPAARRPHRWSSLESWQDDDEA
jgi:poly(3-hydroxybutyrate) depolymerase